VQSNLAVNAAWLAGVDKAVESLSSSQCVPESEVLELRRDTDTVHSLSADVLSHLHQLMSVQSPDAQMQYPPQVA